MKIIIVSDAWRPQINGVVRTLEAVERELKLMGHEIVIIGPNRSSWFSYPMPGYPEITLEFFAGTRLLDILNIIKPDAIHIATEGPLGWSMRRLCLKHGLKFTTAYHSRFPEYMAVRMPCCLKNIVHKLAFAFLRRFHTKSSAILVATASIEDELSKRGFKRLVRWRRGVDINLFRPYGKDFPLYDSLPRPILLYVGRIAREKNLPAFLELKTEGSKVIIGEGPDLEKLREQYPGSLFMGSLEGYALAQAFAAADLFVFPSITETFGLVLLEAAASGLRIAAHPAPGPIDLFNNDKARAFVVLDWNLQKAADKALSLSDDYTIPRRFAESFSWKACAEEFLKYSQI